MNELEHLLEIIRQIIDILWLLLTALYNALDTDNFSQGTKVLMGLSVLAWFGWFMIGFDRRHRYEMEKQIRDNTWISRNRDTDELELCYKFPNKKKADRYQLQDATHYSKSTGAFYFPEHGWVRALNPDDPYGRNNSSLRAYKREGLTFEIVD